MNQWTEKFKESFLLIEIMGVFLILLVFFTTSYFIFLHTDIAHYQSNDHAFKSQRQILLNRQLLASSDIQTMASLKKWQKHQPEFYQTVQSNPSLDSLMQKVIPIAQQSGFSIIQAEPIVSHAQNPHQKIHSASFIKLRVTGQYAFLFYFIDQLNQLMWPLIITQLHISNQNQFELSLQVRGLSEA
jgi:hypothetical protein